MTGKLLEDEKYMRRCLQLARQGLLLAPPNPMVGAVVVCQGQIVGEGFHHHAGGPHAEVMAIRSVRNPQLLPQSTLYVSLEPCAHYGKTPPCTQLIIQKRIPRVVVGCQDPFAKVNGLGIRQLREAGVDVRVGVLERECLRLNRRFITFHRYRRPFVTLKWAQTADGFVDRERDASEAPLQISSPFHQILVHRERASHQAIMVGTHTALRDRPSLTLRLWPGRQPLRVTIDNHDQIPSSSPLKDGKAETLIFSHHETLEEMLAALHERQIQSLLVEGGPKLLNSFLKTALWDELRVETNLQLRIGKGVAAPALLDVTLMERHLIDGHLLSRYLPVSSPWI